MEARHRNQNVAMTQLIAEIAQPNLPPSEIYERVAAGITEILVSEAGLLLFMGESQPELVVKSSTETELRWVYPIEIGEDEHVLWQCLQNSKPLITNNGNVNTKILRTVLPGMDIQSILCAPLNIDGRSLGLVAVLNKRGGDYNAHDEELLGLMATFLAGVTYNARLIQQLKISNADLEAMRWQLLRSRNILRALFDSVPVSFYIIDQKFALVAINMNRAKIADSRPNMLWGKHCYEALYQRQDACQDCRVLESLYGGQNTNRINRIWKPDGESQEWEINTYPIRDEDGQVVQAILFEQDVTEKHRMEATLAQSEKLAAVGQLAAGVAHEINNPLTAILANAQLLQRELNPDDDRQELVDLITRAGTRAAQVVRNLLDLARKEHYEFLPTDINETIQNALALVHHELVSRPIQLTLDLAGDLPLIEASKDHLQGVWLNLMMNAIDALNNAPGELRVSTRQQGSAIHIILADTGMGIPPERIQRIFEPFYTTKNPGHGTGLGLSVCHRIVKQHGGHILVNSRIGAGTEFEVVLPIQ